jgi:hypothetical protein
MSTSNTRPHDIKNKASAQLLPGNPCFNNDRPPPPCGQPRTDDALFHYSDDEFEEQERQWRERRLRMLEDVESTRERWQDMIFDEWSVYVAVLLLTTMVVLILVGTWRL